MDKVEVIITKPMVAYHNGFTRSEYEVKSKQSFEKDFALKMIEEGFCVAFKARETKPSPIKKETKIAKVVRKSEKQNKRPTGK